MGMVLISMIFALQSALANAPLSSQRPIARPVLKAAFTPRQTDVVVYFNAKIRPAARPNVEPVKPTPVRLTRRGSVCGNRHIRGLEIPRIHGRLKGCGIRNPVQITEVAGVKLSTPATLDCSAAIALNRWVEKGAKRAVRRRGGGIESLHVVAHYSCRTRNNQPGAKLSEHANGRAIDIAAIRLKDGSSITVLDDWGRRRKGRMLKQMHEAACGIFGTVLGPNSDRYHRDHFHFDTAKHRNGSYCR